MDKLFSALAKAQGQFKTVNASEEVSFNAGGRQVSYKYANLAGIWDMIRKPLSDNGLCVIQLMSEGELVTILAHESGQEIRETWTLPGGGDMKTLGANVSYMRRYALQSIVGVAVAEEDNENVADGEIKPATKKAAPKPAQPAPVSAHPQPAPNGDKHAPKLAADAMTTYWLKARELGIERPVAAQILQNNKGDAVKALDELTGVTQPPLINAETPQGPGAAYDESGPV